MKKTTTPIVSVVLFLTAILFNTAIYSVEISELDEITMQVLDIDDNSQFELVTPQMIRIPLPIMNHKENKSQSKSFAKSSTIHRRDLNTKSNSIPKQ